MDSAQSSPSSSAPLAPSTPAAGAAPPPPPPKKRNYRFAAFKNRRHKLEEIENSLKHKLTLLDWSAQLTASNENLGRKLSIRNASTSDLYQILGFFFVFEGVVITAVAQASAIKCRYSWLIFALSLLATAATLLACIQKMKEIGKGKRNYAEERALCSSLYNSIEKLKEAGTDADFDLEENQPKLRDSYSNRDVQSSDQLGLSVRARAFWRTWIWSYAGGVFFVLLAFSGITLAAVHLIMCDPKRND